MKRVLKNSKRDLAIAQGNALHPLCDNIALQKIRLTALANLSNPMPKGCSCSIFFGFGFKTLAKNFIFGQVLAGFYQLIAILSRSSHPHDFFTTAKGLKKFVASPWTSPVSIGEFSRYLLLVWSLATYF